MREGGRERELETERRREGGREGRREGDRERGREGSGAEEERGRGGERERGRLTGPPSTSSEIANPRFLIQPVIIFDTSHLQ